MKLLLLKTLLQRRARDEGFTLPMVIALGLVMVLLGVISLTTANEENITAISQNSKSDALAIAEVGVARFRELLDRNRELTIYDDFQWVARSARTEVCNNEDRDISSFLRGISQNLVDSGDLDNDGNTTEIIGSYSLVSYNYSNADSVFNRTDDALNNDALGTLTVQGTAADNSSKAQIQVDIPIRINPDDLTNLAPALWIGNSGITSLGDLTIGNGNVVIKDQATSTTDGCRNFSDANTADGSENLASTVTFPVPSATTPPTSRGTVISDSRNLPLITKIDGDVAGARAAWSATSPINTPDNGTIIPDTVLFGLATVDGKPYNPDDKTKDCPNIKLCRYYYDPPETTGLTYTNTDLLTDGIARTTLLLDQNLTLNATTRAIKIGSTSTVVNDSNTFEIYVKGNRNITINATEDITINGFIHAPQGTLTINGSGTVTINGSVWVNDFVNNSSATVNISPDNITRVPTPSDPSTSGKSYKFYSTTDEFYGGIPDMTNRPLTGSPTNWKTEEVN